MKIKILILVVAIFFSPLVSLAQWGSDESRVDIETKEFLHRGDSVYLNLIVHANGVKNVKKDRALDIIPILSNGTTSIDLPSVSFKSKKNYRNFQRQKALLSSKKRVKYVMPYHVERTNQDGSRQIQYNYAFAYEPWMDGAQLDAKIDLCGCGKTEKLFFRRLSNRMNSERVIIDRYQIQPHLAYLKPEVETEKQREERQEMILDFDVNSSVLKATKGNNMEKLAQTTAGLEDVKNAKGVYIRRFIVTGYASPEGNIERNSQLSEARAKSVKEYLYTHSSYPANMYTVRFEGEDWDYLTRLVAASNIHQKQDVLDIIVNYSDISKRKQKLKDLSNGEVFKEMLETLFPTLRRVICTIDYEVKRFNLEEAKSVFQTHPRNLSLSEMYTVANSYEVGSPEFTDVFETAVHLFPNDETALLNAASSALSRGDYITAERHLKLVQDLSVTPQYWNSMGVLELFKGNYAQAELHLAKAVDGGVMAAELNLKELYKKQANSEDIDKN